MSRDDAFPLFPTLAWRYRAGLSAMGALIALRPGESLLLHGSTPRRFSALTARLRAAAPGASFRYVSRSVDEGIEALCVEPFTEDMFAD